MKRYILLLFLCIASLPSYAQMQSFLSRFEVSDQLGGFAEISLIQRSRENRDSIYSIGSVLVMLPHEKDGKELKLEYNRFITHVAQAFDLEGQAFQTVQLLYDNETNDPGDDLFILEVPFKVSRDVLREELTHYEGKDIMRDSFRKAARGDVTYTKEKLKKIRTR